MTETDKSCLMISSSFHEHCISWGEATSHFDCRSPISHSAKARRKRRLQLRCTEKHQRRLQFANRSRSIAIVGRQGLIVISKLEAGFRASPVPGVPTMVRVTFFALLMVAALACSSSHSRGAAKSTRAR